MSAFTAGARILASSLGGGFEPATVLEVNPVSGLLRVRFDNGRETWLASYNAKAAPGAPPAQPAAPAAQPVAPPPLAAPAPAFQPAAAAPVQPSDNPAPAAPPPPPPGEFAPVKGAPIDDPSGGTPNTGS